MFFVLHREYGFQYYQPPMVQRRHRRRRYPVAHKERLARIRRLISLGFLVLAVLFIGNKTLDFFGVGNAIRRTATVLHIEELGVINVSVDGGPLKRAEDELKLYAGDTVVSSPRNNATLSFFDESSVRLDESTQVRIAESYEGEESSVMTVELEEGTLWVSTPTLAVYSGSTVRTISSPYMSIEVPSRSEFVVTPRSLTVFSADGLGLEVAVAGNDQRVMIGEGQQFTLPVGGEGVPDLYAYRSPLDPQQLQSEFVEESRRVYALQKTPDSIVTTGSEDPEDSADDVALTVEAPEDGTTIQSSAVVVSGRIGGGVDKVRINGYLANINAQNSTFEQELVLPDEDTIDIIIEAVDEDGIVLSETLRTVTRDREPPEPPTITAPAGNGETYLTNSTEIEITGTAPDSAIGIEVNGYRLQLFEPGDSEWSYLANTSFNNYQFGENVYEVVAINRGGYRSDPATLIVTLGEGDEGVVPSGSGSASARPTGTVEESKLPTNTPLMPGAISIYAPAAGTEYNATEKEFLIEGNVPQETASVWVNGYKLQLYEQGKGFFNYIASTDLSTLKRGRNVYKIAIRSDTGHLLDEVNYVVNFAPGRE